jgi:hypothetical protein
VELDEEESLSMKEYQKFQEMFLKPESDDFDIDSESGDSLEIFRDSYQTVSRKSEIPLRRTNHQTLFGDGKQFKKFMESEDSFDGYLENATKLQHKWFDKFIPTEEDKQFENIETAFQNPVSYEPLSLSSKRINSEESIFVETNRNFDNSICIKLYLF